MRDVLIVDDDFMVAEIHRRFVDRVPGPRAEPERPNGLVLEGLRDSGVDQEQVCARAPRQPHTHAQLPPELKAAIRRKCSNEPLPPRLLDKIAMTKSRELFAKP